MVVGRRACAGPAVDRHYVLWHMKPPAEDLERRRPVWEALSTVFLDTKIHDTLRAEIAETLRSSGYSDAELEQILWGELCPVLHVNLLGPAGEWAGFDMEWVEQQILSKPADRLKQWLSYVNGGNLARHDWRRIKDAIAIRRAT
jgi:hypothetical protein